MKKLIYYSPCIPILGFIVHILWPIHQRDMCSLYDNDPAYYFSMLFQGAGAGLIVSYFLFSNL